MKQTWLNINWNLICCFKSSLGTTGFIIFEFCMNLFFRKIKECLFAFLSNPRNFEKIVWNPPLPTAETDVTALCQLTNMFVTGERNLGWPLFPLSKIVYKPGIILFCSRSINKTRLCFLYCKILICMMFDRRCFPSSNQRGIPFEWFYGISCTDFRLLSIFF